MIADLRAQLESPAVEFAETGEIRQLSLRIFDRSFAVTYVLEIAAIVIGTRRNRRDFFIAGDRAHARVRHAAPYRADTAPDTADARVRGRAADGPGDRGRALATGLVVSLMLINVINPQSFNWTMDFNAPHMLIADADGRR